MGGQAAPFPVRPAGAQVTTLCSLPVGLRAWGQPRSPPGRGPARPAGRAEAGSLRSLELQRVLGGGQGQGRPLSSAPHSQPGRLGHVPPSSRATVPCPSAPLGQVCTCAGPGAPARHAYQRGQGVRAVLLQPALSSPGTACPPPPQSHLVRPSAGPSYSGQPWGDLGPWPGWVRLVLPPPGTLVPGTRPAGFARRSGATPEPSLLCAPCPCYLGSGAELTTPPARPRRGLRNAAAHHRNGGGYCPLSVARSVSGTVCPFPHTVPWVPSSTRRWSPFSPSPRGSVPSSRSGGRPARRPGPHPGESGPPAWSPWAQPHRGAGGRVWGRAERSVSPDMSRPDPQGTPSAGIFQGGVTGSGVGTSKPPLSVLPETCDIQLYRPPPGLWAAPAPRWGFPHRLLPVAPPLCPVRLSPLSLSLTHRFHRSTQLGPDSG